VSALPFRTAVAVAVSVPCTHHGPNGYGKIELVIIIIVIYLLNSILFERMNGDGKLAETDDVIFTAF